MIKFLHNLALFLVNTANFFANFFWRKYFKNHNIGSGRNFRTQFFSPNFCPCSVGETVDDNCDLYYMTLGSLDITLATYWLLLAVFNVFIFNSINVFSFLAGQKS
jgi:hypothetical protein